MGDSRKVNSLTTQLHHALYKLKVSFSIAFVDKCKMHRLHNWWTSWSWSISFGRKNSSSNVPSTSNGSNFSSGSIVSALKDSTKLTSSNTKKVVRFAEYNGKVVAEVFNDGDRDNTINVKQPLEESLEEVYIKDGRISGFIKVKHLESGRQVLVRYTEDNWKCFKQVESRRVERIIDSKGKMQIKRVKERNSILSRRRKQVNPSVDYTYLFEFCMDQAEVHQVELVVISSLNDVIDINHKQCYQIKCPRFGWEANGTGPSPRDICDNSRQS